MPQSTDVETIRSRVLVRLETLLRLRWLAILGQSIAIFTIAFVLQFPMPWIVASVLIGFSAILNLVLSRRYKSSHRLPGNGVFALLAFDILQLGLLLFLTGGLQNPFAILLMAPVVVSATSLGLFHTVTLGALGGVISTLLVFFYLPLPWRAGESFELPFIYVAGVWVAIVCTIAFTAIYAFRVAEEARKLADALTATELVLQREQHLSALDGLAAAAAHELGTPLATIALVSKEMVHTFPDDSPLREDAKLLRSQAQRCREILQKLTSLSTQNSEILERQALSALVEESAAPLRDFGVAITMRTSGEASHEPHTLRSPAVQYGLGNLIDNAVDFAKTEVIVESHWNDDSVSITVQDDGPGFPTDLISRLGDPFLTTRQRDRNRTDDGHYHAHGLGLGLFIAKTLLERNGAELTFSNHRNESGARLGAKVTVTWPRTEFENHMPASA